MGQGERNMRLADRRVRRSRRAMMGAFDRLIMTTPLDEISVSAIAREADVDRKTFYQHFGTIDGLLDAIAEEVVSELLDEVELAMAARLDEGEGLRPLQAFFEVITERLSRNETLQQSYFEHVPAELLFDRLARPLTRQIVERGWHIAFGGASTFKANAFVREALHEVPLDRLHLETDCPYLAPQPWRGKTNEPALTVFTAECLAGELGMSTEELWTLTGENTRRFFGM